MPGCMRPQRRCARRLLITRWIGIGLKGIAGHVGRAVRRTWLHRSRVCTRKGSALTWKEMLVGPEGFFGQDHSRVAARKPDAVVGILAGCARSYSCDLTEI
jgi:hypothetical protein